MVIHLDRSPLDFFFLGRVISAQVQNFAFPFVELDDILVGAFLQPVKIALNSSTTVLSIRHSSQFFIHGRYAESTPASHCPGH